MEIYQKTIEELLDEFHDSLNLNLKDEDYMNRLKIQSGKSVERYSALSFAANIEEEYKKLLRDKKKLYQVS